jgi:predicted metal-dependent hydrolase
MEPRAMKSSEKEEKFERGLRHFNARDFFEAHEVWEEIWLVEDEPEKTFLQGIIQIMRFPAEHRGLAIHDLREEAKFWARALGEMQRPGDARLPAIRRLDNSAMVSDSRPAQVHRDKR